MKGLDPLTRVESSIGAGIYINVISAAYGADPTGVADSATAISSAISAADALGGGTVYFPQGTYLINTTITALASSTGVILMGDGATITTTLNGTLFSLNSATRFRATGLRFVGNFSGTYTNQRPFNANPNGTDIEIDHCRFETISNGMFFADGGGQINIHHNIFNTVMAPIQFGTGAIKTGIFIWANDFFGDAAQPTDDAIALSGANQDVEIAFNYIDQGGSSGSSLIRGKGILFESSSTGISSQRGVIAYNIIRNVIGTHALQVNTAAILVTSVGATEDWVDLTIAHNIVNNNYRGVFVERAGTGLVISKNKSRVTTQDAFSMNNTGNDAIIEGNQSYSAGRFSFQITNPDRPHILNNISDGAGDSGFWLDASASPIILGNRSRNSVNDGMFINNTLNSIIDGNNLSDNGRYGLNLGGTSANTPLGFTNVFTGNATAPINGGSVSVAGTVTTVSVVTANGVSGSVATATTTPAITLSLGAITPSSVTSSGAHQTGNYLHVAKDKPAAAGSNTAVWFTNAAVGVGYAELAIKGYGAGNGASLSIGTNSSSDFVLLQTGGGRVAIGNTDPQQVLDVTGNIAVSGTKVIGARDTGWTAGTGTANKGAFATYAGQNVSAGYVEAEAQATDDATKANSQRLKAIEDALRAHGLID